MELKKKDFVEIKFTGKTSDGEVFDSNIKEDLVSQGITPEANRVKPFIFPLGQDMFLKAVDDFLIGKKISKFPEKFTLKLKPEQAFGKRNPELIQTISLKNFKEHNVNPVPGAFFNFDGNQGKILAVSGGRIMVDFNHALAGKDVEYNLQITKKIDDTSEKVKALNDFFFRQEVPFKIKDKKLILSPKQEFMQVAELFKDKYKKILGLEVEISSEDKGEEKPEN